MAQDLFLSIKFYRHTDIPIHLHILRGWFLTITSYCIVGKGRTIAMRVQIACKASSIHYLPLYRESLLAPG